MNNFRNILIWSLVVGVLIAVFQIFRGGEFARDKVALSFSEFLTKVDQKQISTVKMHGRFIDGRTADGNFFSTYSPEYPDLVKRLSENGVQIDAIPPDNKINSLFSIFISWFPMLLLIGVWVFFMRQMQSGSGRTLGFGKSKAKLLNASKGGRITFADVAGVDEAKEELAELVDFLKDPGKFQKLGGRVPSGYLLVGPPGTGKTMLAKAIASEANVPFFSISGSDFVEMFVGVGASRVRDLFEQARPKTPCLIFIDEIDAVGKRRGVGVTGSNDEREHTLNQLLVEMDGFASGEEGSGKGVMIVAATNRPDVLDPALLRPGRFDRQVVLSNPDINSREQILTVHLKKIKCGGDIQPKLIAKGTPGFSGAHLANLVNEAALLAARKNKKVVEQEDLENAKDKVMMGLERRSLVMSDEDKLTIAYHEGGHALVALFAKESDPIHKVTVIPRGTSLGSVYRLPDDRLFYRLDKVLADIAVAMGGRLAEKIIFGDNRISSGAAQDIKVATRIAKAAVTEWGMNDNVGPVYHANDESLAWNMMPEPKSQKTSELIDQEVNKMIQIGLNFAKYILTEHIDKLHLLAKTLIERETLSGIQVLNVVLGKGIDSKEESVGEIAALSVSEFGQDVIGQDVKSDKSKKTAK